EELRGVHPVRVAGEREKRLSVVRSKDARSPVPARGDHLRSVLAERDIGHVVSVAGQRRDLTPGLDLPDSAETVRTRTRDEISAGAVGDREDVAHLTAEPPQEPSG